MPYRYSRACFVYIAKCGEFTKVGVALDTDRRLMSLRTACPYPIDIVARRQFPSEEAARGAERMIHDALREQAHQGEWFRNGPRSATNLLFEHYETARSVYRDLPKVDDDMASGQQTAPTFDLAEITRQSRL